MDYNLSEKVTAYGVYPITAQSSASGYEDSDTASLTYTIGPTITINSNRYLVITDVITGVTGFSLYIDDVLKGTYSYDYSANWSIDLDAIENLADGKHIVNVCANGDGIAENRSNDLNYFRGTAPIYGVSGIYGSNPTLTRTDDAEGMSYIITSSQGTIDSDFDEVFPWNEAYVSDETVGKMLVMPDMYFRIGYDANNRLTDAAVSSIPSGGGDWYFIPSFKIGCYGSSLSSSKLASRSGVSRNYTTRANFRTYARNNGEGYSINDLKHRTVFLLLFMIEYATKKSDSVMSGHISSGRLSTGGTDDVETPSGFNVSTGQMRYHYIEDFVGNMFEIIDGVYKSPVGTASFVTDNPNNFSDTTDNKNQLCYVEPSDGWLTALGWDPDNPFMCLPIECSGGSNSTYFCDYSYSYSGSTAYPVVYCGAWYGYSDTYFGLFFFDQMYVSYSLDYYGARLLYTS